MNRIAELRKGRNLTQKEFGKIIGVAQNTICNWENGKREPDYKSLKKMAYFFNCSTDYLLGRTPFGLTFVFDDQIDPKLDWSGRPQTENSGEEEPAPVPESRLTFPPEYEFLNPTNKAIVDRLIADLVRSQPSDPMSKKYAAASDGSGHEAEADADTTPPDNVQVLSDEYKGKTGDTDPAPKKK